jgi:hypothetical protein
MIRVLHVPVGGAPAVIEIEPGLAAMQSLVGGYIEAVHQRRLLPPGVCLYCNEEGIELELPPNGCGILGAYFFSAIDSRGNARSLDSGELAACSVFYLMHRTIQHPCAR